MTAIVDDRELLEPTWMCSPALLAERINPESRKPYPHIVLMAEENMMSVLDPNIFVHATQTQNQVGKSSTVAEGVGTWLMEMFPTLPLMVGSHSAALSRRTGRAIRNNFEMNPGILRTRISKDSRASDRWHTTAGGTMIATSVGGGVGHSATVFIGDDLLRNFAMAQNPNNRAKAINWLMDDVIGKLRKHIVQIPDGKGGTKPFTIHPTILLPATRYHLDDPTGRMLEAFGDRARVTHLPGFADPEIMDPDPLGRKPGEVLCPDFYSKEEMVNLKSLMDPTTFSTMVQGTPRDLTGGLVNREWWAWSKKAPPVQERRATFTSWDLTFKQTGQSWVVGQLWCVTDNPVDPSFYNVHLLDQVRRKAGFLDQRLIIRAFAERYPEATHHLIEDAANGSAIIEDLSLPYVDTQVRDPSGARAAPQRGDAIGEKRWPPMTGVVPVRASQSKVDRLLAVSPLIEGGRVLLPSWWEPQLEPRYPGDLGDTEMPGESFAGLINECAELLTAATDDQADTLSQALGWVKTHMSKPAKVDFEVVQARRMRRR